MTFTTPDPAPELEVAFAEFAGRAATTVRLHPRPSEPGPRSSSLGGPLLWPADEPWPYCTDDECAIEGETPLIAVLQLYARDVPELPFPDGTDICQVLWCPAMNGDAGYPAAVVRWRSESSVRNVLADPPEPDDDEVIDEYIPRPCELFPERVTDHPAAWQVDAALQSHSDEQRLLYFHQFQAAPGTKAVGWASWIQDPEYPSCGDCGQPMTHLLTIASWEWDGETWRRWMPLEELPADRRDGSMPAEAMEHQKPTGLMLGDAGSMYFFVCTHCPSRPTTAVGQQ